MLPRTADYTCLQGGGEQPKDEHDKEEAVGESKSWQGSSPHLEFKTFTKKTLSIQCRSGFFSRKIYPPIFDEFPVFSEIFSVGLGLVGAKIAPNREISKFPRKK